MYCTRIESVCISGLDCKGISAHGVALDYRIEIIGISDVAYGISGITVPQIP